MVDNIENRIVELGHTNSNCDDISNTPEDMTGANPSGEGLSCFIGELDWLHGFSKDDVVWYHPKSSYTIRRSKVAEVRSDKMSLNNKLILENGDMVNTFDAFRSKKGVLQHLISSVKSDISQHKVTLANAQFRLGESERILRVLEKQASKMEE